MLANCNYDNDGDVDCYDNHDHTPDHFLPQMLANCNYAITLGKQMGFSLVGISGVVHHVLIIILSFLMA